MTKAPSLRRALKLATTGGREYADAEYTARVLRFYKKKAERQNLVLVVYQGGARGSDTLVREWCKSQGVPCFTCDACWDFFGNSAGPVRNGWILEFSGIGHGFVFPGGSGTADMMDRFENYGVQVLTPRTFKETA